MFMVSKSIEYFEKFAAGIRPATNDFYMWYFTLTGIHLLHVVFGTSLLTYLWINSRAGSLPAARIGLCPNVLRPTGTWSTCCGL